MSNKLRDLYKQIDNLNIPVSERTLIKSNIGKCIESQVEECANALADVHNENEMTDSDVIWIELDDSQAAVRKASFN